MRVAGFVQSLAFSSDQPAITAGEGPPSIRLHGSGKQEWHDLGTAILVTSSIVPVVVIILIFVGFAWVKSESLRLKIWNWLESEMRGQDEGPPNAPSNAHERTP
jgi:hypothetical protein